jgi:hypothetical protein
VRFPNPPHNVYGPYITSTAVIKRKRTTGNSYHISQVHSFTEAGDCLSIHLDIQ